MTDTHSVTTFVMGERFPWPDDASDTREKGPFDAGILHDSGSRRNCSIRKISALGATLCGEVEKAPGHSVAVELATGQRPAATIDWVKDGETGIRFSQPIDVLALINRKLVSQTAERRAMPRVEIRCGISLKCGQEFAPAVVRNISANGLQIEGEALPRVGSYVSMFLDGLNVPPGEVVWRSGNLAGIELLEDLSWSSIMPWIRELVRRQPQ
ncbi:MAG TPA: PilZ domain-containing protein [Sphingomicrobium sp.]|nr:PilZ domain-containing protein [Sphingomicrobium sp.]